MTYKQFFIALLIYISFEALNIIQAKIQAITRWLVFSGYIISILSFCHALIVFNWLLLEFYLALCGSACHLISMKRLDRLLLFALRFLDCDWLLLIDGDLLIDGAIIEFFVDFGTLWTEKMKIETIGNANVYNNIIILY